ncbi:Sortase (surface protein transpeptidase) [Listeria grayi]|nr:Sortase (surface protein transpeptidase) [Listeria grayi]
MFAPPFFRKEMTMRKNKKRWILLLLLVALLLTLGMGGLFAYQDHQHAKDKETYQKVMKQAAQKQSSISDKPAKRPDPSKTVKVERPTMKDLQAFSQTKAYQQAIINKIGSISIPDFELVLPIIQETTNAHLKAGVTTYNDTKLGKGNFVLLGHNMGEQGILFSDVPTLKKGDALNVTVGTETKRYQVSKKKVVKYTDGTALLPTKNEQLTLITCDKGTATDYRVVITALPMD